MTRRSRLYFILLLLFSLNTKAQKRGDPKLYYWTIWFTTKGCLDSSQIIPSLHDSTRDISHSNWVQSFNYPQEAADYYQSLKSTGRALIWHRYLTKVDTASIYIDSFNMVTRKYSFESNKK